MKCAECGEEHDELPDIGSEAPYQWRDELDDADDNLLTEDLCIIDGEDYFIRGVLEVPLADQDDYFGWGVWVSLKKENFETYREHFESDSIGPFFGWLSTVIDYFPETTLNLPTTVSEADPKKRTTARSIPASMRPKQLPAVATQSNDGSCSKSPNTVSTSGRSRKRHEKASDASLFRLTIIIRMTFYATSRPGTSYRERPSDSG